MKPIHSFLIGSFCSRIFCNLRLKTSYQDDILPLLKLLGAEADGLAKGELGFQTSLEDVDLRLVTRLSSLGDVYLCLNKVRRYKDIFIKTI